MRPATGPYRQRPAPLTFGVKAEMHGHVTAKPDGSSWWLDVLPEQEPVA